MENVAFVIEMEARYALHLQLCVSAAMDRARLQSQGRARYISRHSRLQALPYTRYQFALRSGLRVVRDRADIDG